MPITLYTINDVTVFCAVLADCLGSDSETPLFTSRFAHTRHLPWCLLYNNKHSKSKENIKSSIVNSQKIF